MPVRSLGRSLGHCSPGWAALPMNPAGPGPWLTPAGMGSGLALQEEQPGQTPLKATGLGQSWGPRAKEMWEQRGHARQNIGANGLGRGKSWPPGLHRDRRQSYTRPFPEVSPLFSSTAEESAPNHSCQSPSPASQDGEKERGLFPERMIPARNAKVRASEQMGKVL